MEMHGNAMHGNEIYLVQGNEFMVELESGTLFALINAQGEYWIGNGRWICLSNDKNKESC